MRLRRCRGRITASLLGLAMAAAGAHAADLPPGFTPLFNGKNLDGWHGWAIHAKGAGPADLAKLSPEERAKLVAGWTADAAKHWKAEGDELVNDGKGAYLATDREFGDYELLIDYKTVAKADSGIYLKAAPQVQIWDSTEEAKFNIGANKGSGGLYNNAAGSVGKDPLVKADKPFGEWNYFRIVQVGSRTTVYLNDKLVVDHATLDNYWDKGKPLPPKGPIILQTHGGEIRWKNIAVRELPPAEANAWLLKANADTFTPLFDGKSLAGWAGATDNYEVKDGAIMCKPGKGGVLHAEKPYADFVARVEFRLPPGGNNGLAVRYPGKGDTAYVGMCEVQILDNDAKKYAKLDPRQYCGSVYGMIPAARGYLRAVGEWNVMQLTVVGPKITVELNGNVITNGDVSKVTDYMAKSPHPGKDRTEGFFGFAGHSDPVEFRNVSIKSLAASK